MIPWLLAIAGLIGAGLAAAGTPEAAWWAFAVWLPANVGQLDLALRRGDRAQAILWLGYCFVCLLGLSRW